MKATQHTPAPWSIEWDHKSNSPEFIRAFVDGEMEDIAIISPDTPLANAHLIAAAPELLAACQTLLEVFESGQNYETRNPYTRPEVEAAINAIAKAKGESKWTANTKDAALATLNKAAEQVYNIEGDQWQEAYETIEAVINKLNQQQPNQY